ncbi:MAG TPA: peptidoglycan-binding domain-containing protein [Pseudomonadota bacterium]|nr:peptidoglycan-binding domain-containing protein [Pseudomonadota bacterium]
MSDILKKGAKGDTVRDVQQRLRNLGFALEPDGHFGDITHNAVIAMQAIFGYDIDGMVGPATLKLIHKQSELGWNLERARNNGYPQNPTQAQA